MDIVVEEAKYNMVIQTVELRFRFSEKVTNRLLRSLTGITYDEAIHFLGRMCDEGILQRRGRAGGTHYVRIRGRSRK